MGMTDCEIVAAVIDQLMRKVAPMLDRMEQRLSRIGELAARAPCRSISSAWSANDLRP
jgi:hypothetical protein